MIPVIVAIIVAVTILSAISLITQSRERTAKIASENWLTAQREMAAAQRGIVRDAAKHEREQREQS